MPNKDLSAELIKLFESEDGNLFAPKIKRSLPTADDRLVESFQEIIDFIEAQERHPELTSSDINEAILAKRLESLRNDSEKVSKLEPYDSLGLLVIPDPPKSIEELMEKDEFGLFKSEGSNVLKIKKALVSPRAEPEEVARRDRAKDFKKFKKGFQDVQEKLARGEYILMTFTNVEQLKVNHYYVNAGQLLLVAEIGEEKLVHGRMKSRIRAIFENGTESNMYLRSLSSQLYYEGYCVVDSTLVLEDSGKEDPATGYIYIAKALSIDPAINTVANLYKIGFSRKDVKNRVSAAEDDPTYLMSKVEIVESYRLTGNYNPQKVEHMIHKIFADAVLDLGITSKLGKEYSPKEWFSVPLHTIRHAIELIHSGEIVDYYYDSNSEKMVKTKSS